MTSLCWPGPAPFGQNPASENEALSLCPGVRGGSEGPSPGSPIKYSEVVLDSEPKPQASDPEPELYASVCAQGRRARPSFPDQAYANSHPAPS